MTRMGAVVGLGVVLLGCSGGSSAPGTPGEFCEQTAQLLCGREWSCINPDTLPDSNEKACVDRQHAERACAAYTDTRCGSGGTFSQSDAVACNAAIEAASCQDVLAGNYGAACDAVCGAGGADGGAGDGGTDGGAQDGGSDGGTADAGPDGGGGGSVLGIPCGPSFQNCPGGEDCVHVPGAGSQTDGYCSPRCGGSDAACAVDYTGPGTPRCILAAPGGTSADLCLIQCASTADCPSPLVCLQVPGLPIMGCVVP